MTTITIPDNWLPTSENINALPRPIRDYIMRLHANTDPAGELRRAMIAEMERDALRKAIAEAPEGWVGTVKRGAISQVVVHLSAMQQIGWADGKRLKLLEVG